MSSVEGGQLWMVGSCLINGNGGDSLNYMDGGFLMHGDGGGDGRLR